MNPTPFVVCVLAAIALGEAPSKPASVGRSQPPSAGVTAMPRVLTNDFAPGVYESAPFTCIVVVPDQNIDADFAIAPGSFSSGMPVFRPELHLIPRSTRK